MGSLRDAWEAEAGNWAAFARAPGHDHYFWRFNLPRFLDLLPPPGQLTVDLGSGEGRVPRLLEARGYRVIGLDASPTLVRLAREEGGPTIWAKLMDDLARRDTRVAGETVD